MSSGGKAEWGESSRAIMADMEGNAKRAVLAEMRQAHEIAALSGRGVREMRSDLVCWKREGRIFSVEYGGTEYFPPFAFNSITGFQPHPVLAEALRILKAGHWGGDWAVATWFIGLSSFLDDQRPMDLVASDPEWVLEAAKDAVNSLNHRNQ